MMPGAGGATLFMLLLISSCAFWSCSAVAVDGEPSMMLPGAAHHVLKPAIVLDTHATTRRGLRAVQKVDSCYSIEPRGVCDQGEALHCCKEECSSTFGGCIKGDIKALCRTSRPLNVCCKGS